MNARKLRILHVVPTYYPAVRYGGTLPAVHGLAKALVARGHDVHVYTTSMDGPGDLDVPLDRPVMMDDVQVHYFRVPALRRLAVAPAMRRGLRQAIGTFDRIHLHSIYLWPTAMAAREARRARIPYVMSPHGMLIGDIIRRKSRWLKWAWINAVERRSLAGAAALHVTADLEAEAARALGLQLPAMHCVPNGLDIPFSFVPLEQGPLAGIPRPYALFLSRISWKKGLDRLIRAWQYVPDLALIIAGNDEENYVSRLKSMPEFTIVRDRVHFVGAVSDTHKWALYRNAEMFVLPSYSENFGYVVAEAMAMGRPVIITPEVGVAPLVAATEAGIVVGGDPLQFAASVRSLQADRTRADQLGANGRRTVAAQLSWAHVAARMEAMYMDMSASATG